MAKKAASKGKKALDGLVKQYGERKGRIIYDAKVRKGKLPRE